MIKYWIPIAAMFSGGCETPSAPCYSSQWGYSNGEFDRYIFIGSEKTQEGIIYDPSGQNISPQLIDRLTDEVEICLQQGIDRTSFQVKIAGDWVLNCDQTQQVLPDPVWEGWSGCYAKGQKPTAECPFCRWRAGIKCPGTLITTPSFYLYKDVLIRFITGNPDPWGDPILAKCATPSTLPLSDGSKE